MRGIIGALFGVLFVIVIALGLFGDVVSETYETFTGSSTVVNASVEHHNLISTIGTYIPVLFLAMLFVGIWRFVS